MNFRRKAIIGALALATTAVVAQMMVVRDGRTYEDLRSRIFGERDNQVVIITGGFVPGDGLAGAYYWDSDGGISDNAPDYLASTLKPGGGWVRLEGLSVGTDSQTLSVTNTDLTISGGNTVDLSVIQDGTGTDNQTLAFTNTVLTITNGNSVDLVSLKDNWGTQLVVVDGVTITGDGSGTPLVATAATDNWGSQVAVTDGVTITGNGTSGSPLASPILGERTGVTDTSSIDMSLTGTNVSATIILDTAQTNNMASITTNGLYVNPALGTNTTTVSDTGSIDLTLTGADISGVVLYSSDGGNQAVAGGDGGIFVPDLEGTTVSDTDSIDLTLTGVDITADLLLDTVTGSGNNIAVITAGQGLYVPPGGGNNFATANLFFTGPRIHDMLLNYMNIVGGTAITNEVYTNGALSAFQWAVDTDAGVGQNAPGTMLLSSDGANVGVYEVLLDNSTGTNQFRMDLSAGNASVTIDTTTTNDHASVFFESTPSGNSKYVIEAKNIIWGATEGATNRVHFHTADDATGGQDETGLLEILGGNGGLILTSPDNTRWKVYVDNAGALQTTSSF